MTNDTHVHIFENHGLGLAPYHYEGCTSKATTCEYCGTPILYQFWLTSADGKRFFVGSDCIMKSGDAGLMRRIEADVKKHLKELRADRNKALLDQFTSFCVSRYGSVDGIFHNVNGPWGNQPHPWAWKAGQGATLADSNRRIWHLSGESKRASLARKWLLELGQALPGRKRGARAAQKAQKTAAAPRSQYVPYTKPVQPTLPVVAPKPVVVPPPPARPVPSIPPLQGCLFKKIGVR